jgi:hypothetical protein
MKPTRYARGPVLDRRSVLRGLGGLALGLPLLDVMRGGAAQAGAGDIPKRYLLAFGGFSLTSDNTEEPPLLVPYGEGYGYALHETASSLADLQGDLTWLSGLSIPRGTSDSDIPPGGRHYDQNAFHQHGNPMLAGLRMVGDGRDGVVTGPTTDQRVADLLGVNTRLRSLNVRAQVLDYAADQDPYAGVLAWRASGDRVDPVPAYTSPANVFRTLTQGFTPVDPSEAARLAADLGRRKSVLDFVDRRMGGLYGRLGVSDQSRLQRHWDELRELERRLQLPTVDEAGSCRAPLDFGADPPIRTNGESDENERIARFHELIRFALACDLTRSVTFMYTQFLASLSCTVFGGPDRPMHDVIHFGPFEDVERLVAWHMEKWGDLVRTLRDTPEGDGSLLDNVAAGYLIEGGYGFFDFMPRTMTHATEQMLMIVAGRAGGMMPGRHVITQPGANHPVQALTSLMQAVGVEATGHGEVDGWIPEVFS